MNIKLPESWPERVDRWGKPSRWHDTRAALKVLALAGGFLLACVLVALAQVPPSEEDCRLHPGIVYCDAYVSITKSGVLPPAYAPGVVASTDQVEVCGIVGGLSYSKRHRATSAEMKTAVRKRDGMARCSEVDHRLPLSLGGADAIDNLWCEGGVPPWGYKIKDALETHVWEAVCKHHTMTLAEGQAVFLAPDWRVGYCAIIKGPPCPP